MSKGAEQSGIRDVLRDAVPHDPIWMESRWRGRVRNRLAEWYRQNSRDLPWRRTRDPYRIWVSEIMLQQTQVATVIPYYKRFLKSFPTVGDLANADEQALLRHWEGLGYYRRARSMHEAAKQIVEFHDGSFPTDYDSVIALKGIGRYTAGAILSISSDQRLPILEGNTVRVFSRWVALQAQHTQKQSTQLLWEIADAMLPRRSSAGVSSSTFNQAAMELGALICTPKKPKCDVCPVKRSCRARHLDLQDEIPGKVKDIQYEDRTEFALIVPQWPSVRSPKGSNTKFLIRPLPDGGRWAGLWDFPRTSAESLESVQAAAKVLGKTLGRKIEPGMRLKSIKHAVTKYRITLHVHSASIPSKPSSIRAPWRFASLSEMEQLPMSVTGRKITKLLSNEQTRSDHSKSPVSMRHKKK